VIHAMIKKNLNFLIKIIAMNHIPTKIQKEDFNLYIRPFLTTAKRGYVSLIPLHLIFNGILYKLYSGCQWKSLPTKEFMDEEKDIELSYQAFYYHFRKWSKDESLYYVFRASMIAILMHINLSEINLDGTHTIAKKGGEAVDYQRRKRAKTSNILPITHRIGNVVGFLPLTAGNHNDAYKLKQRMTDFFKWFNTLNIGSLRGAYFNADAAFDVKAVRKVIFNYGLIPNIPENNRNRKGVKKGRKRLFNQKVYDNRYTNERTHAWADKFRGILIRFDRKADYWLGANLIVFAMINFRHVFKK